MDIDLRVGILTMLAALPASWRAALQCAAPRTEWMLSMGSSDRRVWRREACGQLHVTHLGKRHRPPPTRNTAGLTSRRFAARPWLARVACTHVAPSAGAGIRQGAKGAGARGR